MYGTRLYFVPSTHLQLLLQVAQPHEVPCLLRARDLVSDEPYFLQSLRHTVSEWKVTLSHGRPDAPLNPGNARDGDSGERTSAEYSRRFNLARLMADEMAGGVVSSFICTMYRMSDESHVWYTPTEGFANSPASSSHLSFLLHGLPRPIAVQYLHGMHDTTAVGHAFPHRQTRGQCFNEHPARREFV